MEITEVRVFPVQEEKLRAFVSVVLDHCFMVNDIKVIQGRNGFFISMPSRRKKNGDFKDIAHPLNNDTRRWLEDRILLEYESKVDVRARRRPPKSPKTPAEQSRTAPEEVSVAVETAPESPPPEPEKDRPSRRLDEVEKHHLSDSFWSAS